MNEKTDVQTTRRMDRQTDRQTDGWMDSQRTDGLTDRQTGGWTDEQPAGQMDGQTERQVDEWTNRHTGQADGQMNIKMDRWMGGRVAEEMEWSEGEMGRETFMCNCMPWAAFDCDYLMVVSYITLVSLSVHAIIIMEHNMQ